MKKTFEEKHYVKLSNLKVCRKIKKLKLKRKRLTHVPNERNTREKIYARAEYATHTGWQVRFYYVPGNEPVYKNTPVDKLRNNNVMMQ